MCGRRRPISGMAATSSTTSAIRSPTIIFRYRRRGIHVIDVIDIQYGPLQSKGPLVRANPNYHHTQQDTFDKISAKSLQIVGDVAMTLVK